MHLVQKIRRFFNQISETRQKVDEIQQTLGRIEFRQLQTLSDSDFHHHEFKVYSQWGEDGLIQYLIANLTVPKRFVEFGVENYTESNTRFLLTNNNWSGLIMDGSQSNIDYIKNDDIYWRYNLKAVCAFITKDNINDLLKQNGMSGEIGLLSIDIDGNDYWVWDAIKQIEPIVVIVEYNARFGASEAVTIPYDPNFNRGLAHYSNTYYGASLCALDYLAKQKGYSLVGCNSSGNNAFFVKTTHLTEKITGKSPSEVFVSHQFRESRSTTGKLSYLDKEAEKKILLTLPLIKIPSGLNEVS